MYQIGDCYLKQNGIYHLPYSQGFDSCQRRRRGRMSHFPGSQATVEKAAHLPDSINVEFRAVMVLWTSGALISEVNDEFFSFLRFDVSYRFLL
jgi:hypothetical protein